MMLRAMMDIRGYRVVGVAGYGYARIVPGRYRACDGSIFWKNLPLRGEFGHQEKLKLNSFVRRFYRRLNVSAYNG